MGFGCAFMLFVIGASLPAAPFFLYFMKVFFTKSIVNSVEISRICIKSQFGKSDRRQLLGMWKVYRSSTWRCTKKLLSEKNRFRPLVYGECLMNRDLAY